jgi:hypothetical protein
VVPYFESTAASKERKAQRPAAAPQLNSTHGGGGGGGGNSEDEKSADYNVFQFKAYYCRGSRAESGSTISTWSAAFYV